MFSYILIKSYSSVFIGILLHCSIFHSAFPAYLSISYVTTLFLVTNKPLHTIQLKSTTLKTKLKCRILPVIPSKIGVLFAVLLGIYDAFTTSCFNALELNLKTLI